jgi:DNA recombination protein RmuC
MSATWVVMAVVVLVCLIVACIALVLSITLRKSMLDFIGKAEKSFQETQVSLRSLERIDQQHNMLLEENRATAALQTATDELRRRQEAQELSLNALRTYLTQMGADLKDIVGNTQHTLAQQLQTAQSVTDELRRRQQIHEQRLNDLVNQITEIDAVLKNSVSTSQSALIQQLQEAKSILDILKERGEQIRAQQANANGILNNLERIIAGSRSRGAAGENILDSFLEVLPAEWKEYQVMVNGRQVEFAFKLPNQRLVPIDSKWVGVEELSRLESDSSSEETARILRGLEDKLRQKVQEVTRYLDPDRTLGIGIVAVPDAVYANTRSVHVEALRKRIVIISYSMAVPYLLTLCHLVALYVPNSTLDLEKLHIQIQKLNQLLQEMSEEVNSRLSRGITMVTNSREELQKKLTDAQRELLPINYSIQDEGAELPTVISSE